MWTIMLGLITLLSLLCPLHTPAADFVCTAGDIHCLITSITAANANGEGDNRMTLEAGVYPLTQPGTQTVDGANAFPTITAGGLVIQAREGTVVLLRPDTAPLFRFFQVAEGARLTLDGLTLQGGAVSTTLAQDGGCILNAGALTIQDSLVLDCEARTGGAIRSGAHATLEVRRSAFLGHLALLGGAIVADGPDTVIRLSTFQQSRAEAYGALLIVAPEDSPAILRSLTLLDNQSTRTNGGAIGTQGPVLITDTFCDGNSAGTRGGCLYAHDGQLTLRRLAITHNTAEAFGAGAALEVGGPRRRPDVEIIASQILGNRVTFGFAGGVHNPNAEPVVLRRSQVAGNSALIGPDCVGAVALINSRLGDPTGCTVVPEH